jgi:hypothetical protein
VLALAAVTVIPWVPASPPRPTLPPVARPCRLSQLHVAGADPKAGVFDNGAGGSVVGWVSFRNDGGACSLLGRPRVLLVGGASSGVRQVQKRLRGETNAADVLPPPFSVRALPHARTARVQIWWSNWCASRPPTAIELTMPSGGSVRLKVASAPRCDVPDSPSTATVGTFAPLVPAPRQSTRLPLRVSFDRASYRVSAGTVLRYRVTLRNTGREPFRFSGCPLYFESLGNAHEIHVLNCRSAGTLDPGGSATFAMELRLPRGIRRGRNGLFWEIGLGTYLPPSWGARATVTG